MTNLLTRPTEHTGFTLPSSFLLTYSTFAPIWRLDNVVNFTHFLTLLHRAHAIWPEVGVHVLETRLVLCLLD